MVFTSMSATITPRISKFLSILFVLHNALKSRTLNPLL